MTATPDGPAVPPAPAATPPDPAEASAAPPPGGLVHPPALAGAAKAIFDASRTLFRYGNRYAMVPFHRAGLAAWLGNPLTGWQCLVTTTGRRSGLPRATPLGYLVVDGAAWVMAGYGPATLWFRNILDEPRVTLLLPGRPPLPAVATEACDPSTRARIIPPLARSMALPGAMIGCLPAASSDERILGCVSWVPLVRIRPADGSPLLPGPDDPGGRGWVWRQGVLLVASGGLLLVVRRLLRA